jgi:hypothetical protein
MVAYTFSGSAGSACYASSRVKTPHQQLVEAFMAKAGQAVPDRPTADVDKEVRLLRAKLIFEEALETIEALGVCICVEPTNNDYNVAGVQELLDSTTMEIAD